MTRRLRDYLDDQGPITSGRAVQMMADEGVRPDAARKRLERLGSDVQKLQHCGLPQNQALLYLKKDWLSPRFKDVEFPRFPGQIADVTMRQADQNWPARN